MSRANTLRPRGSPAHGNIEEAISTQLTERECTILDKGVTAYRKQGDITMLVQSLSTVLNTNKKRQLLVPIRDAYVKPTDRIKFNNLAVKYGIAVTRDGTKKREKTLERERTVSGTRKIDVKRDRVGEWGFSVRGGSEHGIGIFVSWVDPGSQAQKAGLQSGDQILKVNETSFEGISHYEATQTLRGCRKARLWLKLQGKFPAGMQYATKSYRWVNAVGQPASPPPERMTAGTDSLRANSKVRLDPDERKVSVMVSEGKELGISIRGGAEHGLGIYISRVDDGSVADDYGLKPGDQILEVNGVSFISILHSEAAKALRTQRLMVVKVKDVGKIPHSRVTAIGQTEWQSSPQNSMTLPSKTSSRAVSQELLNQRHTSPSTPVFAQGAGTQVMLTKSSSPARGIMNEVARSLLTVQELSTFKYYITEYEQNRVSVEDLAHALLQMLNTKEKIQLITEVRNIIRGEDLEQFNEMTIQKEIEARMQNRRPLHGSSQLSMSSDDGGIQARGIGSYTINTQETNLLDEQLPEFNQQAGDGPMLLAVRRTKEEDEDSLDRIPQRIAPSIPKFHVPPPPSSFPPVSSTPNQDLMADTMKDRRRKIHPNSMDSQLLLESAWEEGNTSSMIDEDTLQRRLKETEERLKAEYEEMQQKLLEEQAKKIEEEQRQLFEAEKAELEYQIQNQSKEKMEEEIWQQAEEHMREELKAEISKETEERLRDEFERELQKKMAENLKRRDSDMRRKNVSRLEEEEQLRIELEEQIKTETEEQVRIEYEERLQRESEEKARLAEEVKSYRNLRESLEQEKKQRQQLEQARKEAEEKARREAEEKEKLEELLREAKDQAEEERRQAEENEHLLRQREERLREEEEERRRMEEQRKMREEARRREEKKRQRAEEQHRKEEERRREEEERRREEEERQREEEERRREEEEEARRREEEEEFRQREEEEQRHQQEEELRQQEERMMREEEEMRLREEEEMRLREEEQQREREEQKRRQKEKERQRKERERKNAATAAFDPRAMDNLIMQSGSVSGGTAPAPTAAVVPRRTNPSNGSAQSRRQQIEEERRKAEQMLMRQMMRSKPAPTEETDGQTYGGYTDLKGKIQTVTVTKVSRKLGIAVEGGATTKNQKGVVIRQITPDGSAALTGQDLMVGQQILTVGGKSLKGLKHKDAVITIKNAFDGPMNKKIEFVVLEHEEQETE